MMQMMGEEEHEGAHGMMQQCMEMMNSMMGGGAMDASGTASMGSNLSLALAVTLGLAVALGYLLGAARKSKPQV
jgi:glutamate/tyrosine decarboxylase-like PLP-dependent enzyme